MKLVIVESPAKSKTIQNYLGSDYVVESSIGHIRDLSMKGKGGFGVDINTTMIYSEMQNCFVSMTVTPSSNICAARLALW